MLRGAFYNEIDPYAAQWLRNLIAAGLIPPGVVDERSIADIAPEELHGFTQWHFFAGVGGWPLALRRAGWPDDRPVATASAPCQPFSAAGAGLGFDDERHLWPACFHHLEQLRPPVVFGEQVASKAVDEWIDLVCADLEAVDYAFGAISFPSAGVGAPHIRDRCYWVADADDEGLEGWGGVQQRAAERLAGARGVAGGLAHTELHNRSGRVSGAHGRPTVQPDRLGAAGGLADADSGAGGQGGAVDGGRHSRGDAQSRARSGCSGMPSGAGPVNGFWRAADWLACTDAKWRAVEPSAFPLAHGIPARVGRLRAYGNAINVEAAVAFIQAWLEVRRERSGLTCVEDLA